MRDRVFGIETEYAVLYHPGRGEQERPSQLALYRMFEPHLARAVPSLPCAFSPLRFRWGRFLANGSSFEYAPNTEDFEHGLIEMASPECRDPFSLLACENAKDQLLEELASHVGAELREQGYRGELRIGKNNVDSEGHTLGSHENYWIEDALPLRRKLLLAPCFAAIWALSIPVLLSFVAVLVLQLLAAIALPLGILLALLAGVLLQQIPGRARAARDLRRAGSALVARVDALVKAAGANADAAMRWLRWLERPLEWIALLHSAVYRRFHFQRLEQQLTAFLVTRIAYAGAGCVRLDGGPLFRIAQRPPFLQQMSGMFTPGAGDARPLYETRDLFFRPWSAFASRRRLHLLMGDANLCDWALVLRVGATALVLEAIEAGDTQDWPLIAAPLAALRALNDDPSLRQRIELADGRSLTALEIQQLYLDRARHTALGGSGPTAAWKLRVLRMWQETLELLARDPGALADRIDWIAKQQLIARELPSAADREALRARAAWLFRDTPKDEEGARLRELGYRVLRADLRYHELGPRGLHRRLRLAHRVRELAPRERIESARQDPPPDTRAHARGLAIREAGNRGQRGSANWHRVRLGPLDWRWFPDPLSPTARRLLP